MLDDERVERIEDRLNAATEGPWRAVPDHLSQDIYGVKGAWIQSIVNEEPVVPVILDSIDDTIFITYSWEDIRDLLSERNKHKAEITRLKALTEYQSNIIDSWSRDRET